MNTFPLPDFDQDLPIRLDFRIIDRGNRLVGLTEIIPLFSPDAGEVVWHFKEEDLPPVSPWVRFKAWLGRKFS